MKKSGKAVKRLDWLAPTLVHTSADSSGNGHRLNPSRPSIPQGAFQGGGGRGHKFKSLGKLSNSCTDWHQILYTSADSSGNGHTPRLNTIRPTISQGHFRGSQIQMFGEAVKRLYRLAPHLVHICGFVFYPPLYHNICSKERSTGSRNI